MGKKKKIDEKIEEKQEFDFEKAYNDILEQAKRTGMYEDMIFQTLLREFKAINDVCVRLKKSIDEDNVCDFIEGSKGQYAWKTNPAIKDYVAAQKNLVSISSALEKKLANDSTSSNGLFD